MQDKENNILLGNEEKGILHFEGTLNNKLLIEKILNVLFVFWEFIVAKLIHLAQ